MQSRKIVDGAVVEFLDSKVPKEITDEILAYVVCRKVTLPFEAEWCDEFRDVFIGDNRYTTHFCAKCGKPLSGHLSDVENVEWDEDDEDDEGCQIISWEYDTYEHKCGEDHRKEDEKNLFLKRLRDFWSGKMKVNF
nr:hypothetical protein K-LCC10_0485 [Kaumoebavirus]